MRDGMAAHGTPGLCVACDGLHLLAYGCPSKMADANVARLAKVDGVQASFGSFFPLPAEWAAG